MKKIKDLVINNFTYKIYNNNLFKTSQYEQNISAAFLFHTKTKSNKAWEII